MFLFNLMWFKFSKNLEYYNYENYNCKKYCWTELVYYYDNNLDQYCHNLKMCTNHGWLIFLLHRMWTLLYVCILSDQILSSIWMIPHCCIFDALCWCSFYKSLLAFPKSWYCPSQTDNLARLSEGSSIFELSSHLISYEFEIDFAIVY